MTHPAAPGDHCPTCDGELLFLGFLRCRRENEHVCRTPLWCRRCDRVWTRWADRDDPLEPDDLFPQNWKPPHRRH